MAQAIYREWFVHFRHLPNSQESGPNAEADHFPASWTRMTAGEAMAVSGGGTPSRSEPSYWDGGTIAWFTPTDLTRAKTMFIASSSQRITPLGLSKSSAKLFPPRSVLMTSRATIGAVAISKTEACTNQGFIVCEPNERISEFFIYFWLRERVPEFKTLASGATFKELSRGEFRRLQIALPPVDLMTHFHTAVKPLGDSIERMLEMNECLRSLRDFLLPKLVSGQIDVSKLGLEGLIEEAV
ncbi:MAG: restriction endonuclease subunit S [Actinomycetota bacterium]